MIYLTTMPQASLVSKHSLLYELLCSWQQSAVCSKVVVLKSVAPRPAATVAAEHVRNANSQLLPQILQTMGRTTLLLVENICVLTSPPGNSGAHSSLRSSIWDPFPLILNEGTKEQRRPAACPRLPEPRCLGFLIKITWETHYHFLALPRFGNSGSPGLEPQNLHFLSDARVWNLIPGLPLDHSHIVLSSCHCKIPFLPFSPHP